jgi:hypothetical protein
MAVISVVETTVNWAAAPLKVTLVAGQTVAQYDDLVPGLATSGTALTTGGNPIEKRKTRAVSGSASRGCGAVEVAIGNLE